MLSSTCQVRRPAAWDEKGTHPRNKVIHGKTMRRKELQPHRKYSRSDHALGITNILGLHHFRLEGERAAAAICASNEVLH